MGTKVGQNTARKGGINPGKPDIYGQAPLLCAAVRGHEGVVKILLGRDDVNPTNQISTAKHRSGVLLWVGARGW